MLKIEFFINTFNAREKAILVWLLIILFWGLLHKNVRSSMIRMIRTIFHVKIVLLFFTMFAYVLSMIYFLFKLHILNISLIKDIIFWVLGSAIILLMNINKAIDENHYFLNILLDNLKLLIIIEFIMALYSFNFWIEMILIPVIFIFTAIRVLNEIKKEYLQIKKFIDFVLASIGLFLIIYSISRIVSDYRGFVSINNFQSFIIPPLLTLLYISFLFIISIIIVYESLFFNLNIFFKNDHALLIFLKTQILRYCLFSHKKLRCISKNIGYYLNKIKSRNDVDIIMHKYGINVGKN